MSWLYSSPWCHYAQISDMFQVSVFQCKDFSVKSNHFWYRNRRLGRAWPSKGRPYMNWMMQRRGRWDGWISSKQTYGVSASKGLAFWGGYPSASILFLCVSGSGIATEAGAHISEPTCHEFIRAEKGVGWQQGKHRYVLNTSWLMQFPTKGNRDIPQVSLCTEVSSEMANG